MTNPTPSNKDEQDLEDAFNGKWRPANPTPSNNKFIGKYGFCEVCGKAPTVNGLCKNHRTTPSNDELQKILDYSPDPIQDLNNWANKKVIEALENVKGNVGQLKHSDVLDEVDKIIDSEIEALRKKGDV